MWKDEFGGDKNPVAFREYKDWRTVERRSINNLAIVWTPIKDFNVKMSGGYDYMDIQEDVFTPGEIKSFTTISDANRSANLVGNWNYSLTGDYRWKMKERHSFNALVGNEYQRSDSYGYGIYFPEAEGPIYNNEELLNEAANVNKTSGNPQIFSFLSYFGRINYMLDDKYIFQATARVDGSSRFGRNNRYGFFPAVSVGWIVSDEKFLKDNKHISYLKLRSSYGITGNANFDNYAYIGTYSAADNGILYNQNPIIFPLNASNPDLQWETSATFDAAMEVGLWSDRITFELAYYNKRSKDVLLNVNLPPSTGFTSYWDNVAEVLNRGVEFSIKSRNLVREFQWTTEFNIARNYNELVDIGEYTPDAVGGGTNDSRVIVGKPIGSFYLVEYSHVDPENGLPVYLDLNGNETYDYDNAIRKYVGDGLPDFIGGITNNFRFKKWDLNLLATYSVGGKIFDSSSKRQLGVVSGWNMREEIFDRWTNPGDESTFPRLTLDETTYSLPSGFPWWNTSLFLFDASYLRLRQATLGYNFKDVKRGKVELSNIRLAFTAFNIFTLTDFPGLDPEVVRDFENAQDRNLSPNVTYLTPPQERSYNLQLSFNF
jgi:TonB-linked SusC/RagA family outer membrane protein